MEHLIPQQWFVGMHGGLLALVGAVALVFIIKGADWLVEGASGMALRLGISKVIVGATIVSLGTTSPEAAVSVMAAFGGDAGLALGNAVGSIIADTGLIFGMGCVMTALPVDRFILNRQGWVQFGAAALLAGISYILWALHGGAAQLGRVVGVTMLGLLAWYLWASVRWGRRHTAMMNAKAAAEGPAGVGEEEAVMAKAGHEAWWKLGLLFGVGLILVVVSGRVLIGSVEEGALRLGVPQVVIAATIVALGTSLPELMVAITAVRKGHPGLLIGNIVGADVLNVLFVIGASATATPLALVNPAAKIPQIFLVLHVPTMLVILVLFRAYIFAAIRRGHFRRWFGVPLLAIYAVYLVMNYLLGR